VYYLFIKFVANSADSDLADAKSSFFVRFWRREEKMERDAKPGEVVQCTDGSVPIKLPETILGPPPLREVPPDDGFDSFDGDEMPGAEAPLAGEKSAQSPEGGLVQAGPPPCMTTPAYLQSHCRG
jgi:hypothetical protein